MPGIQSDPAKDNYQDPFDYVDPIWTPDTKLTQIGRDLQVAAPLGFTFSGLHAGVSDTQVIPEVTWRLTIRRLMVPFIPRLTFNYLSNKLNAIDKILDNQSQNLKIPAGTARLMTPDVITKRAPDGTLFFDLTLTYEFRMLWESIYDIHDPTPAEIASGKYLKKGWVTWNHMLCAPTTLALQNNKMGYYPVYWVDGVFQIAGERRPMYLRDMDVDNDMVGLPGNVRGDIFSSPLRTGFRVGQ
jgi:hypothetical protein